MTISNTPELFPMYTVKDAMRLLQLSRLSIYRLINSGELRAQKIGHQLRIPHSEMRRLLQPETDGHPPAA